MKKTCTEIRLYNEKENIVLEHCFSVYRIGTGHNGKQFRSLRIPLQIRFTLSIYDMHVRAFVNTHKVQSKKAVAT